MRGEVCARSEQVRERLTGMGWRDFHAGQPQNDDLVTLRARRPSGRLFELTLHRCSGEIVEARWFTREQVRTALSLGDWSSAEASNSELLLPGSVSIAREIIESWAHPED